MEPEESLLSWYTNGRYVYRPTSFQVMAWSLIANPLMFTQLFATTTVLAFRLELLGRFSMVESFFDLVMFVDILITFLTAIPYDDKLSFSDLLESKSVDEKFDVNMYRIGKRYMKGLLLFDLLGCVPSLFTLNMVSSVYVLKMFKLLHMNELF